MDRMLAGVSTRKFEQVGEPVGASVEQECSSTGKTSVSEMFIERTRTALGELMGRRLEDVRLAVMMLDGLEIAERTHVVALAITTEGAKIPLGLWEGSTENATLARTLLADLVDRGLDPEQAILFVIDGAKALQRAIKDVFGEHALVSGLLLSSPRSPRPALALQPARGSLRLRLGSARPVPGAGALVRAIHTTKEAPVAPSNINRVVLTGNLAADPDLRSLPSGASVCRLRLAVNTRRKDSASGEYVDKPNYFDVVVWGAQGKACARYLAKGSPAAIDGHLEWREWQVDGGGKRQAVEVIADAVQFLGGNRREERDAQRPEPTAASEAA
jgi:single-strand DNA-binding protein